MECDKVEIEHIIPCCSFDLRYESEQKKCFHYTNLRPYWALDNLIKASEDKKLSIFPLVKGGKTIVVHNFEFDI